jgi:hypothetical protein
MWTVQTWLSAAYDMATDNTIPLIFGAAVAGGYAFYFYSKSQTDKANLNAKIESAKV